eukprot:snap_masked-scaffold_4-processed-gene-20.18-mRNA-1 protein AED:1.00 eAED:1.00 QI:0/0/0/0/1/1/2/0/61
MKLQYTIRREGSFNEPDANFKNLTGGDCGEIVDYQKNVTIDNFEELANAFIEDCTGKLGEV